MDAMCVFQRLCAGKGSSVFNKPKVFNYSHQRTDMNYLNHCIEYNIIHSKITERCELLALAYCANC